MLFKHSQSFVTKISRIRTAVNPCYSHSQKLDANKRGWTKPTSFCSDIKSVRLVVDTHFLVFLFEALHTRIVAQVLIDREEYIDYFLVFLV
jgi:hypothetical protein